MRSDFSLKNLMSFDKFELYNMSTVSLFMFNLDSDPRNVSSVQKTDNFPPSNNDGGVDAQKV